MKSPEFGKAHEIPAWRVNRIAEIHAELTTLRQLVASNEHLITPDGEDLGEYADNVTVAIAELEAELDELHSPSKETQLDEQDIQHLSKEELEQRIKELRTRVRFLSIQSDTEGARIAQAELDEAEQILKTL